MKKGKLYITVDGTDYEFHPKSHIKNIVDFDDAATEAISVEAKQAKTQIDTVSDYVDEVAKLALTPITKPSGTNLTKTYNTNVQSPSWFNFDDKYVRLVSDGEATDAGNYNAVFRLLHYAYTWADGTKDDVVIPWKIVQATDDLFSTNRNSLTLDASRLTDYIDVTCASGRTVTASSSDNGICVIDSIDGNRITVAAVSPGTANITIKVHENRNYLVSIKTIPVEVRVLTELSDTTPDNIQRAEQGGYAGTIWNVGDSVDIPLSGTVDGVNIEDTYRAVLIAFDHNSVIEGTNKAHFQIMRRFTKDIAFASFKANATATNNGGYLSSNLRTVVRAFENLLPASWKAVITTVPKYSDNAGGTDPTAKMSVTEDKLFILSATEIKGNNNATKSEEATVNAQYAYYANGNSAVKNYHNDYDKPTEQWTRSTVLNTINKFCYIDISGNIATDNGEANVYRAIAPGFVVG